VDLSCLVIGTGKVLLEWHSPQHVGLEECYFKPSNVSEGFFEYLHDEKPTCSHLPVPRRY